MPESAYLNGKPSSPTGLVIVVAVHAAAIAALATAKMDVPLVPDFGPLITRNIPVPVDPPEIPPEVKKQPENKPAARSVVTRPDRIVEAPVERPTDFATSDAPVEPNWSTVQPGQGEAKTVPVQPPPVPIPVPDPVRTEAVMLPSSELLPPYPAVEERLEREGKVTVRLLIGPDGRVVSVEKVSATSDAFWRATERHALRVWRFKPATVDGKPTESRKTLTVNFELRG